MRSRTFGCFLALWLVSLIVKNKYIKKRQDPIPTSSSVLPPPYHLPELFFLTSFTALNSSILILTSPFTGRWGRSYSYTTFSCISAALMSSFNCSISFLFGLSPSYAFSTPRPLHLFSQHARTNSASPLTLTLHRPTCTVPLMYICLILSNLLTSIDFKINKIKVPIFPWK